MTFSPDEQLVESLVALKPETEDELLRHNRALAGQQKRPPLPKSVIARIYRRLVQKQRIAPHPPLETLLLKRPVRTLSGVAPVTLLTKPFPCPGKCVYCPTEPNMPKSYLSNEPAAMRAVLNQFHPARQVASRLDTYLRNGHPADKVEIIILGGTWSAYPRTYQDWFVWNCYHTCNTFRWDKDAPSSWESRPLRGEHLKEEIQRVKESLPDEKSDERRIAAEEMQAVQHENETAQFRIVGLCLETRPDWIRKDEIARMRAYGCTRVQLGVQSIYDDVLTLIKRGHTTEKTIWATKALKDAGMKVDHHYMPNLPGSTPERDLAMMRTICTNPDFCPDQIKIYPTVVNEYAELNRWYQEGKWKPYSQEELVELGISIKRAIPPFVRINRFIRDIPSESIVAGNRITNLRQLIQEEMKRRGLSCQCIRCREARTAAVSPDSVRLFTLKYAASGGWEYFLSLESPDRTTLYSFLRLRIPSQFFHGNSFGAYQTSFPHDLLPELEQAALIREVHTYGSMVPVEEYDSGAVQHRGLGKRLMQRAEEITASLGIPKIAVISGVGVRHYYRKLGYRQEGTYMVKYLQSNL